MKFIFIPAFLISIIIAFTACTKIPPAFIRFIPHAPANTQLFITIDTAIGTVIQTSSADTFVIDLKDPSQCLKVPIVLHIDPAASTDIGTKLNDSTYLDTIDISKNKVAGVTITASNGNATAYGIGFKYIFSNYTKANGLGSDTVRGLYVQGGTIYAATDNGLSVSINGGASFINYTMFNGLASNLVSDVYVQGNAMYAGTLGGLAISVCSWHNSANRTTANPNLSWCRGLIFTNYTRDNGLGSDTVLGVAVHDSTVCAATANGLSISADGGIHYANYTTSSGLGSNMVYGVFIQKDTTSAGKNDTIYASTYGGLSIGYNALGNYGFGNFTTAYGLGSNRVNGSYEQIPNLYAATEGGLSIDGLLSSFTNYTTANGLGDNRVQGVFAKGDTVYAATYGGLSISTNQGRHFANYTMINGLGGNVVTRVTVQGNSIYASTLGGGITIIRSR